MPNFDVKVVLGPGTTLQQWHDPGTELHYRLVGGEEVSLGEYQALPLEDQVGGTLLPYYHDTLGFLSQAEFDALPAPSIPLASSSSLEELAQRLAALSEFQADARAQVRTLPTLSRLRPLPGLPVLRYVATVHQPVRFLMMVGGIEAPPDAALGGDLFAAWIAEQPEAAKPGEQIVSAAGHSSAMFWTPACVGHRTIGFRRQNGGAVLLHIDVGNAT